MVKFLTYFLFVFSFYGYAQISSHHERAWLQDSINTHFTLQSSVFSATDTLLKSDTSIRCFSFYPDVIFSNRFNELKTQLSNGQPIIKCMKDKCHCGLCAPKAKNLNTYQFVIFSFFIFMCGDTVELVREVFCEINVVLCCDEMQLVVEVGCDSHRRVRLLFRVR